MAWQTTRRGVRLGRNGNPSQVQIAIRFMSSAPTRQLWRWRSQWRWGLAVMDSAGEVRRRRQKKRLEESKNDANEDAEGSESAGQSEKEEVDEGDDGESVNDSEAFDSDEEDESAVTCHSINTSSFSKHVCHELSKAGAESLTQKKRKYVWEVPAVGMSNCKWVGTGECFMENDLNYIDSLKKKLYSHWMDICKRSGVKDFHSSRQTWHFSLFNSYRDILHCNKRPFYLKGKEEDSNIMDAYLMHSVRIMSLLLFGDILSNFQ